MPGKSTSTVCRWSVPKSPPPTSPPAIRNTFLPQDNHIGISQKIGSPELREQLRARMDPHDAEHVLIDCLGETIWRAQSQGQPMDAMAYVDAVKRKSSLI